MSMPNTYGLIGLRAVDPSQGLGCLNNGNCLDRDLVPESFTLAVNDAWDEDVALNTVTFGGVDDGRVCSDRL